MARPKKVGLEYFPLDCQMDDKVEMLKAEHGLTGFAAYIILLQHIYQTEAGELDMSVVFRWKTLGKQLDMSVESLQQLLDTMFAIGLFDRTAYDERQVLTSNGIQKRRKRVAGLREKDRSRKAEGDSEDSPTFSDGKPLEKGGKGKGKNTSYSKRKESKNSHSDAAPAAESESGSGDEFDDDSAPRLETASSDLPPTPADATPGKKGKKDRAARPTPPAPPPLENRWPELVARLDAEGQSTWERFVAWEKENPLPKVFSMVEPLLPAQLVNLTRKHGSGTITGILLDMQNRRTLLQDYDSANYTVQSWIRLRQRRESPVTA